MYRLLTAHLYRLWKSKLFWLLTTLSFCLGGCALTLVALNTASLGEAWRNTYTQQYFTLPQLVLTVFTALFAGYFIGTEYAEGTMKNMLIAGHTRRNTYLSYVTITAFAMVLFTIAYVLAAFLVGFPLCGAWWTALSLHPWRPVHWFVTSLESAAFFGLLALLDSRKDRYVVVSLLLAMAMLVLGMVSYGYMRKLSHFSATPAYRFFYLLTALMPSGSALLAMDKSYSPDWYATVIALVVLMLLLAFGMRLFERKDIN